MKKVTKAIMGVVNKILAFVSPIMLIFFAAMMIGQSLPAWTAGAIVAVGWVAMIFAIMAIIYAFINLFT